MQNELLDLIRKKEVDAKKESAMALIAGGLGEALSGETGGEIAAFGNKLAMDRLKRSESIGDAGLKAQMATTAKPTNDKKRFQQTAVQDKDGAIKLMTFDTTTGRYINPEQDMLKGFSAAIKTDPTTGELTRVTKADASPVAKKVATAGAEGAPFTVKQEKDLRNVRSRLDKNSLVKASKNAISQSNRAIELLSAGNDVSDEGIKTIFPRMFGEVGNLAAQEQERFTGSPALTRKWERLKAKGLDNPNFRGTLGPQDRSDLLEVARMMAAYDRRQLANLVRNEARSEAATTGMSEEEILKVLEPAVAMPSYRQGTVRKIRQKPIEGNVVEKFYRGKMRRFKKVKGGWEALD